MVAIAAPALFAGPVADAQLVLEQPPRGEVLAEQAETVKLRNVIPPIRFESGVADIPPSTIERLLRHWRASAHTSDVAVVV